MMYFAILNNWLISANQNSFLQKNWTNILKVRFLKGAGGGGVSALRKNQEENTKHASEPKRTHLLKI